MEDAPLRRHRPRLTVTAFENIALPASTRCRLETDRERASSLEMGPGCVTMLPKVPSAGPLHEPTICAAPPPQLLARSLSARAVVQRRMHHPEWFGPHEYPIRRAFPNILQPAAARMH